MGNWELKLPIHASERSRKLVLNYLKTNGIVTIDKIAKNIPYKRTVVRDALTVLCKNKKVIWELGKTVKGRPPKLWRALNA